jgi:RNA polymerase sigma factor (TIGR02999 family)
MSDVTRILSEVDAGDEDAAGKLFSLVYEELRRIAGYKMGALASGQTLQPTALVHEAFLKLIGSEAQAWKSRSHFFNCAAEAMRQILVDRARKKARLKRGGDRERVDLASVHIAVETDDETLLAVNDALERLEKHDPQAAEFVKLRFFVGFTTSEIADALGVSERTAKRLWAFARAWLIRELR